MSEKEHVLWSSLTPEWYKRFLEVKEDQGVKPDSSVLRVLIAHAYWNLKKQEQLKAK